MFVHNLLLQEVYSKLEITYNSSTNSKFSLSLLGEALVPKVILIEPELEKSNKSYIKFPLTYIGCSRSQQICLKNIGIIPCKTIIEIIDNVNEMLTLEACEDTYDLLNVCDLEGRWFINFAVINYIRFVAGFQNTKFSTLVNLQPQQVANFDLKFIPNCEDIVLACIKIHTVNNPFEVIKVICVYKICFFYNH